MSSFHFAIMRPGRFLALLTIAFALPLMGTFAAAQNNQPIDEVYGGYSWLHPGGYGDRNFKVPDLSSGFDVSNTYYLPRMHNLGIVADGSGDFNATTGVGFALAG